MRNISQPTCKSLAEELETNKNSLITLMKELNSVISGKPSKYGNLDTINNAIKIIGNSNLEIEVKRRDLGCPDEENQKIFIDNQTIISTSSVRRKNQKALVIEPMPIPIT